MFDFNEADCNNNPKQIEINTVAASFNGIGTHKMKMLHEQTLKRAGLADLMSRLPDNPAAKNVAKAFANAWRLYGNPSAVIVFLVNEVEHNIYDQRAFEYEILAQAPEIRIIRKTMNDMAASMEVDNARRLFV